MNLIDEQKHFEDNSSFRCAETYLKYALKSLYKVKRRHRDLKKWHKELVLIHESLKGFIEENDIS